MLPVIQHFTGGEQIVLIAPNGYARIISRFVMVVEIMYAKTAKSDWIAENTTIAVIGTVRPM